MPWFKHGTTQSPDLRLVAAEFGAEGITIYWSCHELYGAYSVEPGPLLIQIAEIALRAVVTKNKTIKILKFFESNLSDLRVTFLKKSIEIKPKYVVLEVNNISELQDEYSRKLQKKSGQNPDKDNKMETEEKEQQRKVINKKNNVVGLSLDFVEENVVKKLTIEQATEIIQKYIHEDAQKMRKIENPGGFLDYWIKRWSNEGDICLNSLRINLQPAVPRSGDNNQFDIEKFRHEITKKAMEPTAKQLIDKTKQIHGGAVRSRVAQTQSPEDLVARQKLLKDQAEELLAQQK